MAHTVSKLEQSLRDLIDAYHELEEQLKKKHLDDVDTLAAAVVEAMESAVDEAIDHQDSSTGKFAELITYLQEALEQLDPSAFEGSEEEEDEDDDIDLDDIDYDDLDEEEDDGDEDDE